MIALSEHSNRTSVHSVIKGDKAVFGV